MMEVDEPPLRNLHGNNEFDFLVELQRNDPELKSLGIGSDEWGQNGGDYFDFPHADDWGRLGECIGDNDHLEELYFGAMEGVTEAQFDDLCLGIARNKSIKRIRFCEPNLFGGKEFEMLTPFFVLSGILESLRVGEQSHVLNDTYAPLDREGLQRLFDALSRFGSLKQFSLSYASDTLYVPLLDDTRRWMQVGLAASLEGHTELQTIDVSGNSIGRDEFFHLAALLGNSSLLTLSLRSCALYDNTALLLGQGLEANSTLNALDISCNTAIAVPGWSAIFYALQNPKCAMEELRLCSCGPTDEAMNALANSLANNTSIKLLDLGDNSRFISNFNIERGVVSTRGWQTFFRLLRTPDHPSLMLEYLGLEANFFGDIEAASLAAALSANTKLRVIDLSLNTGITIAGWKAIATALESPNIGLEKLILSGTSVNDDETVIAFAKSLAANTSLTHLIIDLHFFDGQPTSQPGITAAGWAALETTLCKRSSIADTYFLSNHTLGEISYLGGRVPESIYKLLHMNRWTSKSKTARGKIIQSHFSDCFNMPLKDLDLEVIPHLISWMGRTKEKIFAPACRRYKQVDGISLLFPYLRAMPAIFLQERQVMIVPLSLHEE